MNIRSLVARCLLIPVEDSCYYTVSAGEEIGKLTAKSAMHLPGLQPVFTTQIIGTDGTIFETEAASARP